MKIIVLLFTLGLVSCAGLDVRLTTDSDGNLVVAGGGVIPVEEAK